MYIQLQISTYISYCYIEPFKSRSKFGPKCQRIFITVFLLFLSHYFPLDSDLVSSSNNKDLDVGKNYNYLDIWVYITLGLCDTWIIMRFVRKLYHPSHLKARSSIFSFIQSPVEQPGRKVVTCWIIVSSWSSHCTGEGQRHLQQFSFSNSIFLE